jgi:hypothetical protein
MQDWTPLDRNWIRSRVALLDRSLAVACHVGALTATLNLEPDEQTGDDNLSPLINFDNQVRALPSTMRNQCNFHGLEVVSEKIVHYSFENGLPKKNKKNKYR